MRRTSTSLVFLALLALPALHCRKGKAGDDAATPIASDTASAPEPPPSAPPAAEALAANADDVARFGEETKIAEVAATVVTPSANVRESPPNGPLVAILPKGAAVVEIAQRDAYMLVTFENPKNTSQRLMGWVFAPAVGGSGTAAPASSVAKLRDAAAPPPVVPPTTCPGGLTLVMADLPICAKVCEKDADCPSGQACKGTASRIVKGKAGDGVTTCVVFHHVTTDAGVAPPKVDASAPAVKDAAAPPPVVDAAVPPPPPATGPEVPAVGGKCPATYVLLSKDGKCHKDCTSGSAVCGASRCTKNCNVGPPICLSNAALCAPPK
ncbi:MAG TPA: hypothetical protein PLR99_06470 [Polyangiaceae bacterium]|jgi:hypothetical protein|nr:hypothetical protein [Polyangiaceae bacterium]